MTQAAKTTLLAFSSGRCTQQIAWTKEITEKKSRSWICLQYHVRVFDRYQRWRLRDPLLIQRLQVMEFWTNICKGMKVMRTIDSALKYVILVPPMAEHGAFLA
jgi:hypothetical protein